LISYKKYLDNLQEAISYYKDSGDAPQLFQIHYPEEFNRWYEKCKFREKHKTNKKSNVLTAFGGGVAQIDLWNEFFEFADYEFFTEIYEIKKGKYKQDEN